MPSLTTASLLTEEVTELGHSSRPSSPWSSLSGVLRSPRSRTTSGGYASKIPVLAGQQTLQYQSFRHYLDVDDEDEEPYVEQTAPLRFADPPPTLKELHADGHKITQGTHEDSGLGDDADVWDQYCSEAKEYDEELMNELNGSLDVLLIFAGLFCAVLAALIIESYKMLQPDPQDQTLLVLQAILSTLHNASQPVQNVSPEFTPPLSAVRVNVLWFSSLALALGVAVQVMLAKQWIHKYGEGFSNVPRLRMQLRQYRYDNLRRWALPEMVNFLPTLLHLALALFLLGLVDFLWQIHKLVAAVTFSICLTFSVLYIVVMVLPHIYTDCPYKTPFSRLLGLGYYRLRLIMHGMKRDLSSPPRNIALEKAEYQAIESQRDMLQAKALAWLMKNSRNPVAIRTVAQSLAGITTSFSATPVLRQAGAIQRVAEHFLSCFTENQLPMGYHDDAMVQFQLIKERSAEAGSYAKALVSLIEGLPASWWPQRPPRDLHLYSDVLISALSGLAAQTEDAEVVTFAIAAREHIFRAGRIRYPSNRTRNPVHTLGELLHLISQIAEDELIPGTRGVVCVIDTLRRCVEITSFEQRCEIWNEFYQPLLKILEDTPPKCRVRVSLSRCLACFGGVSHSRDYSDGNDPTEHRLIHALSAILVSTVQRSKAPKSDSQMAESVANALRSILVDYSRSFVHSIRPLGETLSLVLPILFRSQPRLVKVCVLEMVQHADFGDIPTGAFPKLMELLRDRGQSDIHPELARVLQRHLYRPEIGQFLGDIDILRNIFVLLASSDEETQAQASSLVNEICVMGLKAGGKGAQRSALDPLIQADLLQSLNDYFWSSSARVTSDSSSQVFSGQEDNWVPRLLALLDLYPQEVLGSDVMEACVVYCEQMNEAMGQEEPRNLKEWWSRYSEWAKSGSKAPKPRPKGPLFRRVDV